MIIKKGLAFAILLLLVLVLNVSAHTDLDSENQETPIFASDSIKQRAFDISKQISIYLDTHSEMSLEDLKNDSNFREIAIQQVGETGYTYLIVKETGNIDFHLDPDIEKKSYNSLKQNFPTIWEIIEQTMGTDPCQDSFGFYEWEDIENNLRDKYTYHHCVEEQTFDNYSFFIGASTYLDEYKKTPEKINNFWIYFTEAIIALLVLIIIFLIFIRKRYEEKPPIKAMFFGKINRKFIAILSILFLMIILIGILIIFFQNQILKQHLTNSIIENEEDFFDLKEESIRTLSATLEVILQDESLKQIYMQKDRDKLFDYGQPLFTDLKNKYEITHFYFILPDGINFLRLHDKDIYGDKIQRATFLEAQKTKNIGAGIELGETAYALRVVMPYYDSNELIGYIGLGQGIDNFLEIMKKGKHNEFSLIVEKNFLNEQDWESSRKNIGVRNNWDDLEKYIIVSSTTNGTSSCFSDENMDLLREQTSLLKILNFDEHIFACGGFALIDIHNEKSGAMFSMINATEEHAKISDIRFILLFVLFIFFSIFIGIGIYVSQKISKPIIELNIAAEELKKGKFDAKTHIRTGDELEKLGRTFNQTAEVLGKMEAEHKQLEKAKTEFLSITSHELRSPMTPMKAQLQMISKEYYGKLNPKQQQAIDIVEKNTSRLDTIIVDFLEISKIEAARLKFIFKKVDLTDYIKKLSIDMKAFMPKKKIKILTKIEKLPIIKVDPNRTIQILRNLVSNAIKFSKNNSSITISAKLHKNMILFSVKDQGIGISEKDQTRIFEPFFQAEQTMYREHQGTGLGLAIVRGIVESQNGKIWLKSELGKGTTFYFTIPLKPVRTIKPIKLLFSGQKNINKKIKNIFIEILGPIGEQEFKKLEKQTGITQKSISNYITILSKKSILDEEKTKKFKNHILSIFRTKIQKNKIDQLAKKRPFKQIAKKQENLKIN